MRQAVEILVFTQLRTKRNTSKYVFPNDTYASVYVKMKTPNDVYNHYASIKMKGVSN